MNYFSVELCKKLQEKGLVPSQWYVRKKVNSFYNGIRDWTKWFLTEEPPRADKWKKEINVPAFYVDEVIHYESRSAFIFQDLLTKDNAVKLWGEDVKFIEAIDFCVPLELKHDELIKMHSWKLPSYKYHSFRMSLIYQQSGLEAVEKYLMENL